MSSYVENVRKNVAGLGQVQELGKQKPQVYACRLLIGPSSTGQGRLCTVDDYVRMYLGDGDHRQLLVYD